MSEYRVPNMRLVPQDLNNACWWASAVMLLMWKNRFRDPFRMDHPAYHNRLLQTHRANNGLRASQMADLARQLGLRSIPPLRHAPTMVELEALLRRYGPLWADGMALNSTGGFNGAPGTGHVVVIAGVRATPRDEVLIYDPWPPPAATAPGTRANAGGRIYWRPASFLPLMFVREITDPTLLPVSILHAP
jgi:hypothetical protein